MAVAGFKPLVAGCGKTHVGCIAKKPDFGEKWLQVCYTVVVGGIVDNNYFHVHIMRCPLHRSQALLQEMLYVKIYYNYRQQQLKQVRPAKYDVFEWNAK